MADFTVEALSGRQVPTQAHRPAALTTPLGADKLLLSSFTVNEELSSPFLIQVECLSTEENVDFKDAIGKDCEVRLTTVGKKTRYFCGILAEAGWSGEREGFYAYSLVLRPKLWLLTHMQDCRIFQNLTVVEILEQVLHDAGVDMKSMLTES